MRYLDLFAGAGGLSEGLIKAGFENQLHMWKTAKLHVISWRHEDL